MDISRLSMMSSSAKIQSQVSLAVTKLTMNTSKEIAANMNKMLEQSVNPNLGNNLNVRA
ncbi:YjfB family protein [Oceanirhabdus seepicola]|uniref:YjfB family protein n=1 Tax=Oceanirhabdus seepicola TaxID=2828781 RepID=A0A9J6P8Z6_9CLOT|nr:YjfB family protein [Oceanirhabdus seepicola]MCM1992636.1 YjfB family protein [Oceanirhabdus seepicola]